MKIMIMARNEYNDEVLKYIIKKVGERDRKITRELWVGVNKIIDDEEYASIYMPVLIQLLTTLHDIPNPRKIMENIYNNRNN